MEIEAIPGLSTDTTLDYPGEPFASIIDNDTSGWTDGWSDINATILTTFNPYTTLTDSNGDPGLIQHGWSIVADKRSYNSVTEEKQNVLKAYRNASIAGSNTNSTSATQMLISTTFGAWKYRNSGGSTSYFYGNKQCAFASIGDGLTDADAVNFYNAVQTYQTTLNRQV